MILGFDISTSCIGWCLLEEDGTCLDIGHIDLTKEKDFYKKVDIFSSFIDEIGIFDVRIFVEEPVKMFKTNQSMAQTISLLQAFNACCRYVLYTKLKVEPQTIMASSARKAIGVAVPRGANAKEIVLKYVQSLGVIPVDKWAMKKTGKPKTYCFDQADAFVVALGGLRKYESTKII